MEGSFVLPTLRDAMQTIIGDKTHLTERCEAMLADRIMPIGVPTWFSSLIAATNCSASVYDLIDFRLVYQVDGEVVMSLQCRDLDDLNVHLANLSFDNMIAYAEEQINSFHTFAVLACGVLSFPMHRDVPLSKSLLCWNQA